MSVSSAISTKNIVTCGRNGRKKRTREGSSNYIEDIAVRTYRLIQENPQVTLVELFETIVPGGSKNRRIREVVTVIHALGRCSDISKTKYGRNTHDHNNGLAATTKRVKTELSVSGPLTIGQLAERLGVGKRVVNNAVSIPTAIGLYKRQRIKNQLGHTVYVYNCMAEPIVVPTEIFNINFNVELLF